MIRLTKEMIDHIFEPRRELGNPEAWPVNRILTDGKGNLYHVSKRRDGHRTVYDWYQLSRSKPEWDHCDRWGNYSSRPYGLKRGTYPAWVPVPDNALAMIPQLTHEVLPGPITQAEILIAFYRIAFPDWDRIVKIQGYPKVSYKTWIYVADQFRAFDRRMFPDVMAGGAWALGSGFSADHERTGTIPDWRIDISECKVAYADTPYYFRIGRSDYGEPPEVYSSFYPRKIWENGLYDDLEDREGMRRRKSFEQAGADCAQLAGCVIHWHPVPNTNYEAEWVSQSITPATAERAA